MSVLLSPLARAALVQAAGTASYRALAFRCGLPSAAAAAMVVYRERKRARERATPRLEEWQERLAELYTGSVLTCREIAETIAAEHRVVLTRKAVRWQADQMGLRRCPYFEDERWARRARPVAGVSLANSHVYRDGRIARLTPTTGGGR